uniref:UL16/UL94 family protein n=1 Tax=Anatid alphaherpesvirus 2 TaxID=3080522 RepID=A0AAU0K7X3_9ALPH
MADGSSRRRRTHSIPKGDGDETSAALANALNDGVCAWRTLRCDSRLTVMTAIAALSPQLAPYAPPNEGGRLKWMEVIMYLTRPRAMNLTRNSFHVVFLLNRTSVYAVVAQLRVESTRGSGSPDVVLFSSIEALPRPPGVPDAAAETFPLQPAVDPDVDSLAERVCAPRDPNDCVAVSVGAWWSLRDGRLYYLRMEASLMALCPAGWRDRSLGAILSRLMDHERGCSECRPRDGDHVDACNAVWAPGSMGSNCLCRGPCMWRKALQRDVSVDGDVSVCQLLFMDAVDSVRIADHENAPKISGCLGDVISAGGASSRVPVNSSGWHLAALPEMWSRAMIMGCSRLSWIRGTLRY